MFDVFIFFIPMSQTISVINKSGPCYFYMHQTSGACAGQCACNRTHQMDKAGNVYKIIKRSRICLNKKSLSTELTLSGLNSSTAYWHETPGNISASFDKILFLPSMFQENQGNNTLLSYQQQSISFCNSLYQLH